MDREIELEEIETAAFKDRYGAKAMPAQVHSQGRNDGLIAMVSGARTTHFCPEPPPCSAGPGPSRDGAGIRHSGPELGSPRRRA